MSAGSLLFLPRAFAAIKLAQEGQRDDESMAELCLCRDPGEHFHALDGGYGGLGRRNGRPPQMLCGVGFWAQGLFKGSYYRRMPDAADRRARWIFDAIEGDIIGDFGLSGGGAAGFDELDRADLALGTPPNALILARSEGHQRHFVVVPEELLTHVTTVTGERPKALIRATGRIRR